MNKEQYYAVFNTAAGWVGILGSPAGLVKTTLPQKSEKAAVRFLGINPGMAMQSPERFQDLIKRLQAYFSGQKVDFQDKLDLSGATAFQRKIWQAARLIPCGETRSYGWVARQAGKAKAARAAGQALGKNPLPVIVPCHRVLASDGNLGGFGGGLEMKKHLLELEKSGVKNIQ